MLRVSSIKDVFGILAFFAIGTGLILYSINIQSQTTAIIDDAVFTIGLLFMVGGLVIGTTLQNSEMY